MPQINRIRVNNVKYNFGTQFYDDFVMRFSCRNSIYDLANGGGKSVLMLLLLQNLIPNCTLDDKQPVEKLFREGNGCTTIHSLVEWKLDACDIKSGYKYMTTGFCARKARDNGDEDVRNSDTASIEYFNYCIFYREPGDNDIKNLPLQNGRERITYNGLKTYLRDLEKKDFGVEVRIFDRKGDYQNFISNYGLFESQWEIVRGINKTEGHVRTYFENNYKTTRKVVEDLLIEEIIEKSYNNRIRKDANEDDEMARTLLDIKDKLIELSRRRGDIGNYNSQIELLEGFAQNVQGFRDIFEDKKRSEEELLAYYVSCRHRLAGRDARSQELKAQLDEYDSRYREEARLVAMAEIETEAVELDQLEVLIAETTAQKDEQEKELEKKNSELKLKETAADYQDYLEYKSKYEEVKALLNNKDTDQGSMLEELGRLAATKAALIADELAKLGEAVARCRQEYDSGRIALSEAEDKEKEQFGLVRKYEGLKTELAKETQELEKELGVLMSEGQLLVADKAETVLNENLDKIQASETAVAELNRLKQSEEDNIHTTERSISAAESDLAIAKDRFERIKSEFNKSKDVQQHVAFVMKIYQADSMEQLEKAVSDMYTALSRENLNAVRALEALSSYEEHISAHRLPDYDEQLETVLEYLRKRYADDVKSGKELLEGMTGEEAALAVGEFPQLPYVILAGESYDEICADTAVRNLNTGSFVIPVVRTSVFEEGNYPYQEVASIYKDMSFLWDDSALAAQLSKLREDRIRLEDVVRRTADKQQVVENDLFFIKNINASKSLTNLEEELNTAQADIDRLEALRERLIADLDRARAKAVSYEESIKTELKGAKLLEAENVQLKQIAQYNQRLNERYDRIRWAEQMLTEAKREYSNVSAMAKDRAQKLDKADSSRRAAAKRLEELNNDYALKYRQYYDEKLLPYDNMTEEAVDARAGALRTLLNEQMGDISDKEKLLGIYDSSMKKSVDNICYRGMSLEEAQNAYKQGLLIRCEMEELLECKKAAENIRSQIRTIEAAIDSQNAQKNRIEGSLDHAKGQYEAQYGEYVREKLNNPGAFIVSHRQEMSAIMTLKLETEKKSKEIDNTYRDVMLMEKDLERIIRNAGLELPDGDNAADEGVEVTVEAYEAAQKHYEALVKAQARKKNSFDEDKQRLTDALTEHNAYELAQEIRRSLVVPENVGDLDNLLTGIKETNDCIALERDSIEQGISDMERIKDSFENRCIQICSNIRTELERLPKLSRITMDEDVISIITLNIPCIKEEMYKDRMSVYINETVSGAETFANPEDKLKYIKGRLSWKKLFSVIVTDMNSIKLCLYKREHIKDQSRYLKYEEAVGSTGQSQGIYIQFLIAIINYISSINGAGKDSAVTGKTIFIDNPFGTAKDVYIWEPIFKLLKTNHVQLIVPARGATPAITKMFDVNYVLGQKMVSGRQQTVVVDYRSQVQTEEMEYDVMEYEQTTLNLD